MIAGERVEIVGGGFEGLGRAAELARRGIAVHYAEPGLRAGAPFVTESFLTPFRFNLGAPLLSRAQAGAVRVSEPDPLLAVGEARLGRTPIELAPLETAWETLAGSVLPPPQRTLLTALALLLGIDPHASGSGAAVARLARGLDDLVTVIGGNGLAAAALVDEIVAAGGRVTEGLEPPQVRARPRGVGICRLFVGLRGAPPALPAFATAVGFDDEESLGRRLDELRSGRTEQPIGFLLRNEDLDRPGDRLASVVWQGLVAADAGSRADYTAAVLGAIGVREQDVVFRLLWRPDETGESLTADAAQ